MPLTFKIGDLTVRPERANKFLQNLTPPLAQGKLFMEQHDNFEV
jgi:hypothetical protein